jgi:hypothetical protein
LVRKPGGKRLLRRSRYGWEDNIRTDLEGVDWIYLAQDRDQWQAAVNMVMNLEIP